MAVGASIREEVRVDLAQLGLDGLGRAGRAGLGEGRQKRRRAEVVAALVPVDLGRGVTDKRFLFFLEGFFDKANAFI